MYTEQLFTSFVEIRTCIFKSLRHKFEVHVHRL